MGVTLRICVSCPGQRADRTTNGRAIAATPRPAGRYLAQSVLAQADQNLRIIAVGCLNACEHGCNAQLTGEDGWRHITGDLGAHDGPALLKWAAGGERPGRLIASIPPSTSRLSTSRDDT